MSKKLSSLFKYLILLGLLFPIGFLLYRWFTVPTQIRPYPYTLSVKNQPAFHEMRQKAETANILILGDRMGGRLAKYLPQVSKELEPYLKEPLKLVDWTAPQEGLQRSLEKLRSLNKWPNIVIYHGGSSEFAEQLFKLKDVDRILGNFASFHDDLKSSVIMALPWTSKFIYQPVEHMKLGPELVLDKTEYDANQKQRQMEVQFKLFEYEMEEMIELAKQKDSKLFLISVPLKLDTPPRQTCDNAWTPELRQVHSEFEAQLAQTENPIDLSSLEEANAFVPGNAKTFYLLAMGSLRQGEVGRARDYLYRASAFDCSSWRINPVFNQIMQRAANKHGQVAIDFDQMVNDHFSSSVLFLDDLYPQDIYYQMLVKELTLKVKKIFQL